MATSLLALVRPPSLPDALKAVHPMRRKGRQFAKFLLGGLVNTVLTYCIYLVLANWINYQLAYGLAFLAGIGISYFLNVLFVFKVAVSPKAFLSYPLVYAFQYLFSAFLLKILVEHLEMSKSVAPLLVIAVSVPLTYLVVRVFLTSVGQVAPDQQGLRENDRE